MAACDFVAEKPQITLGPHLKSAVIMGNRLRGADGIENLSQGDVQIGLNSSGSIDGKTKSVGRGKL